MKWRELRSFSGINASIHLIKVSEGISYDGVAACVNSGENQSRLFDCERDATIVNIKSGFDEYDEQYK